MTRRTSNLPRFLALAVAIGIFAFDTLSPLRLAIAVLYVIVLLIVATFSGRRGILIAAAGCAALTLLSLLLVHGLDFRDTAPVRAIVGLAAIGITTYLVLKNISANERLGKIQRQRANLARFFSPQLVNELAEMDTPLSLTRYQPATVLFVDMVGFTSYCSTLPPESVIALLRDLLALLSKCVFSHDGIIDKFLGDGLMAVFGAPFSSATDATNAANCALDMLRSIDEWSEQRLRSGEPAIRIAIGIHYGQIAQGDVGSDSRLLFTVAAATENIASRVEAFCRTLDAEILVTAPFVHALLAEGSSTLATTF